MQPDKKYRAFLLDMADAETEASIEEAVIDGRIDPDHLRFVEEDLIDDFLFGRLSLEEKRAFSSEFLSKPERASKVEFVGALKRYAEHHAPKAQHRIALPRLWRLVQILPNAVLAGALGCVVLTAMWLGVRDLSLRRELTQTARENDEHQRLISSLLKEREDRGGKPFPSNSTVAEGAREDSHDLFIRLSPGISRGLATVPVIHLKKKMETVSILLELPFKTVNILREELLNSQERLIWSQQFSNAGVIARHGTVTIVLPTAALATGEYRLRVEADAGVGETGDKASYVFRVREE